MSPRATLQQRTQLERDNANQPETMQPVPPSKWPERRPAGLMWVWRSRHFLVQGFSAPFAVARLTVCRTALDGDQWRSGITWDELQQIKRECGFGHLDAVEVYPRDADVVNDCNMRHLWVMGDPLPFAWRLTSADDHQPAAVAVKEANHVERSG